ncbi:MAG: hypothetical protein ACFFD2_08765 [Promethearchaeota archaeon]
MAKEERNKFGEKKKIRIYIDSKIIGWFFLAIAVILIVQAIINTLSAYSILPMGHIFTYLSDPSAIVTVVREFFITSIILTITFAFIAIICFVELTRAQEWSAGIALTLMGLIATTIILHLINTPCMLGTLSLIFDIITFGIAVMISAHIVKNFKRFD